MNVAPSLLLSVSPAKFSSFPLPFLTGSPVSNFTSQFIAARFSSKIFCTRKEKPDEEFSTLSSDIPWDSGNTWSTMAAYFFSLHIPLSFGGLSIVAQVLHKPSLDPQTEAVSLLIIQITELLGALALLQYTARPQDKLINFFQDVNVLILKEILSSGNAAKASCFIVYCIITPVQEEIVYRGFLLTSLASTMKWQQAVIISACVFSAAHLSWENTPQFFAIGCILGCAYCWTGNLASSFTIHSLYNAVILLSTILA